MLKRVLSAIFVVFFLLAGIHAEAKYADLAGSWYSDSPVRLRSEIEGYLRDARVGRIDGEVIGAIVPHAGLRFSGPVAGYTYKALMEANPDKVILVGFTHRKYFADSISVFTDEDFITPLGKAPTDMGLTKKILSYHENMKDIPEAFIGENSIEVEIPFIQVALKDARLVLIALCDQSKENCRILADALHDVLRDEKNFVILASTDMSHHLPYDVAKKLDTGTIETVKLFDPELFYEKSAEQQPHEHMCGMGAVYSVMTACKRLGADQVEILKYANSGDTSGMKSRVVGYLSAVFIKSRGKASSGRGIDQNVKEEQHMFNRTQKEKLLKMARDTIHHYLETGKRLEVEVDDETLKQDMGAFVTLHKQGQLRGCIGHMAATGPLYLTVRDMAISSATEDWRFPPVKLGDLDDIDIEISALSPMRKIDDYNEIEMGKHGVMVRMGRRSGVYLPQVADETGWDREQFMNSLCAHKAGIPADAWKKGECEIYVFTAEVFGEKEI
ncbi:MAG: AmmeMemoRadiSam system protein B [Candidatus Omnitrophota bacterium]|nr:AmmeMemoRadiSam system protein B [Candidatus Omnitrophota bacterium]